MNIILKVWLIAFIVLLLVRIIGRKVRKLKRWLELRREYARLREEDIKTTMSEIEEYERKQKSKKSGGD